MQNIARDSAKHLTGVLKSVWTSGKALLSFLSLILITPVVTFFLLKDWDQFVGKIDDWLPRDHAPIIRLLTKRINRSISGFLRGQVTISIIVGIFLFDCPDHAWSQIWVVDRSDRRTSQYRTVPWVACGLLNLGHYGGGAILAGMAAHHVCA